tara:strand:+ start:456 stop:1523 length:1068 start_codon:yes stop_codon:yes gene_type:complete
MSSVSIVWLSLDPHRRKIDYYPKHISSIIEKRFKERDIWNSDKCVLGSDFFNATVHFHPSGSLYQTTPGMSMGRAVFKPPGYRSVKRIQLRSSNDTNISIYTKQVQGEWRITNNVIDSEVNFNEQVSTDVLVSGREDNIQNNTFWKPEDLNINDKHVVVWQWCRGVPERQGNLMNLGEEWWIPYLQYQNEIIESSYNANYNNIEITLPTDNSKRLIKFNNNNCYANQVDTIHNKYRFVRRVIITISKLKEKLANMNNQPLDPSILSTLVDSDEIPREYFCCISQDIMKDPVKTTDNHTYDRSSIEQWFRTRYTSPLTGLELNDITLTPNIELRNQIQEYTRLKTSQVQSDNSNNT